MAKVKSDNEADNSSFELHLKNINSVSDVIGSWGPFQRNIFAFVFVGMMFSAFHSLSLSFYAPNIESWCKDFDPKDRNYDEYSTPNKEYKCTQQTDNTTACDAWDYDLSFYSSTIISEWDLVCSRSWLASMTTSCYMFGVFSAVVLAQVSDKVGRYPVMALGLVIEILAGLSCAFSNSVSMFIISRYFLAIGASTRWQLGFVLILETCGPNMRSDLGIAVEFGWAAGYIILPALAYILRNFRYIQLASTLPEILLLGWILYLPESPRWLLANGKYKGAEATLTKAIKVNEIGPQAFQNMALKMDCLVEKFKKENESKSQNVTLIDLWKTPNLRRKTLMLYFTWFVNALVYYGLSLNTNNLGGNPFVNFLLAGAVEFPAYALSMVVLKKFGRKPALVWSMFGAGIALLLTVPFATSDAFIWLRITFAMVGKFCITCSFAIIYVYSAEIYPTVARSVGVASSSTIGRIGSILAPFVKELGQYTQMWVPLFIFGVLSVADGFVILLLPETKGREIPDTIEEAEAFERLPRDKAKNKTITDRFIRFCEGIWI